MVVLLLVVVVVVVVVVMGIVVIVVIHTQYIFLTCGYKKIYKLYIVALLRVEE